jgi:hypothetical protein
MLLVSRWLIALFVVLLFSQCLVASNAPLLEIGDRVRAYTRSIEFDYIDWTLDAVLVKLRQTVLGSERYLDEHAQSQLVRDYIALVADIQRSEGELSVFLANPDPVAVKADIERIQSNLDDFYQRRDEIAPIAESILQAQVGAVIADFGLDTVGQPFPPLLFHGTPLPWALIASPRNTITQEANISLETSQTIEQHIALEDEISANLDLSTLVVPVGGVGTYPTMVAQSSHLNWVTEVIAHEWIHNYLTIRPLGFLYSKNGELTTMNETAANLAGKEIGAAVIERYYPELVPPPPAPEANAPRENETTPPPEPDAEPVFDFRAEMHTTRVRVDEMLANGEIEAAEEYMEARRLFFWEHGYIIRKLNQAYFAFYGSYADTPVGPAGEDPVGAAVRDLRARSTSLEEFIDQMAWLTSYQGLLDLLANGD